MNLEKNWFNKESKAIEEEFKTNINEGLTSKQVEEQRQKFGYNELNADFVPGPKEPSTSNPNSICNALINPATVFIPVSPSVSTCTQFLFPKYVVFIHLCTSNTF